MRISPIKLLHGLLYSTPVLLLTLAACGGGGGGGSTPPTPPAGPFTIGGSITGLTGSGLVLRNNGGDNKTITAGGSYTFTTSVANGGSYNVTVLTQPTSPTQLCSVTGGSGSVSANITNANVTCVSAWTISGIINSSVAGIGPVLQNNLGDNLFTPAIISGSTAFIFNTPVANNQAYSVTQFSRARAPTQNCVVASGSGNATADYNGVVVTCTATAAIPKYAYVANNTANTVSAYTIGGGGALTAAVGTPTVASGNGPYSVAVEPSGRFAYVVNSNADTISAYSIDTVAGTDTGALTLLTDVDAGTTGNQTSIATGDFPISITVHPSGKFAYTVNQGGGATGNTISAYSINATTGALSVMDADGATGTQATIATETLPYAVTVDPLGKFAYVANYASNTISAYTIDPITGALTSVGAAVGAGTGPSSIAIDPTGKCALVANNTSDNVMSYVINSGTGALAFVNTVTGNTGSAPRSIAVEPALGVYAYVANAGGNTVSSAVWSGGTATFTTSTAHGYKVGKVINVSGVTPAGYNGTHTIVTVPTATTFTVAIAAVPGAYSLGGTIAEGSVSALSITYPTCIIASIDTDAVTGGVDPTIAAEITPISVNVDPSGLFVYVANFGSNNVSVYNIGGGGALTPGTPATTATGAGPTSVTTTQ